MLPRGAALPIRIRPFRQAPPRLPLTMTDTDLVSSRSARRGSALARRSAASRRLAGWGLASALLLLALPVAAGPGKAVVAIFPVGEGSALLPTVELARAIATVIERGGKALPRLVYPPPPVPTTAVDTQGALEALEQAVEAFQSLDFDRVRQHATAALELLRAEVASGQGGDGYVDALHLLAATEFFDGQQEAAERAMGDAVIFDPRPPAQDRFNPTVQQFHQQVLQQSSVEAHLSVTSSPDALLWLNRRLVGPASETRALRPGLYWVNIYRPGYRPWRDWVRVEPGEPRQLAVTLVADSEQREAALVTATRRRAEGRALPEAASELLRTEGATELIVVDARPGCGARHCTIVVGHGRAGRWATDTTAPVARPLEATAARLLVGTGWGPPGTGLGADGQGAGLKTCLSDNECPLQLRCRRGVCQHRRSVTRRWWFWTAIGVSAAAVAVGAALPFMLPEKITIEVR